MKTSDDGVALIKLYEGCKLKAYKCPAGVWTIGYGHTTMAGEPTVVEGMKITAVEATNILKRDLKKFEDDVAQSVTVPLSQNQFDALISFAFNVGIGALRKSTLLRKLNAGQYDAVPAELMKWTKAGGKELPGLVKRRRSEAGLWRGVDDFSFDVRAVPDEPPVKTITQSKEANGAVVAGISSAAAVATEVVPLARQGADITTVLTSALGRPTVLVLIAVIVIACAIWVWRKQRLEEHGV
jgi:lysozyme